MDSHNLKCLLGQQPPSPIDADESAADASLQLVASSLVCQH